MANLRDVVKSYQEDLQEGIAWVAFWREGRSWNGTAFHLELDENVNEVLLPEQKEKLEEILAKDPKAVILNGYSSTHLCISAEEVILACLYHGVRWHYQDDTGSKLKHFLEVTEVYNPQAKTGETVSIDEQQKTTFDKDRFLESDFGSHLVEVIIMLDNALKKNDIGTINYCNTYWKAAQAAIYYFYGTRYHFSRGDDYCGIVSVAGDWLFKVR